MSNIKFGRNYVFTVLSPRFKQPLQIGLPFTIEFDVKRHSYTSSNLGKIRLYNLSQYHRGLLQHDQFADPFTNPNLPASQSLSVILSAGYGVGSAWPVIFKGNVYRAWSVREGVNWVTTLECFDAGISYVAATSGFSASAGTPLSQVYELLIADLAKFGVSTGTLSPSIVAGNLSKGQPFFGNTVELLQQLSNGNFFVDNLIANVLAPTDVLGGNVFTINAGSGLLGTPVKEQSWLTFDMLFEPRLHIGSSVILDSSTGVNSYNGPHKVISVHHRAVISPVVSGEAITTLGCRGGIFNTINAAVGR